MFLEQTKGIPTERIPFLDLSGEDYLFFVLNDSKQAKYVYSLVQQTQKEFQTVYLNFFEAETYESSISDYSIFQERARSLSKILAPGKKIIVTTIRGLNYLLPPKDHFLETLRLCRSEKVSMRSLIHKLLDYGYIRSDVVRRMGTFSVRGGIIDIFPPTQSLPIRIDFLGDEIESLKTFDLESQITNGTIDTLDICRCSEIVLNDQAQSLFRQKFKFKNDRIKESIENGNYFPGIEWFQSCFHESMESLLDYIPKDTKFIFDFEIEKYNNEFFRDCRHRFEDAQNALPVTEIFQDSVSKAIQNYEHTKTPPFEENTLFANHKEKYDIRKEKDLARFLRHVSKSNRPTVLSVASNGALGILSNIIKDGKVIESFKDAAQNDQLYVIVSVLNAGFISKDLEIYTESEIFGEVLRFAIRKKKKNQDFLREYSKLSKGDYVVHEKHGIALFEGLVNIDISGIPHDFLSLRYKNDDKLYVPIEDIGLVSRYGDSDSNVSLDLLKKSNSWSIRKNNVRKKLLVIANNLLKIAAQRKLKKIEPFPLPINYPEFVKRFGHIETDDQLSVMEEVISDLSGTSPMDRLVCGDVGFGKTEVALRSAFIVASSLKQVVLLAPTTILVSQHYKNFMKRFDGFGIEICQLSRFVPQAQVKRNLEDIKSGKVQIIIATHSILSEKIHFSDLALVIIDEEQHFGVKQKELLKKYHDNAHFMTLTATPIPRTLQLAISGIKDLSTITTPPKNRLPVRTIVCNYDSKTIRQAIENETKIGGQVFFVTPRVEFLPDLYEGVRKVCPGLRVSMAHGKSPNLEEIIKDFCDCKIDVLISTNIVDSGIDIPNANTILVHRFDLFGLSQLYQLRGRVGRSKRQAYAYLLLDPNRVLSSDSKKRLEVLGSLNSLGAGFNLASHDLDMRGAGNLLGDEQSGYIKEVGIELYQSMLREAILMIQAGYQTSNCEKQEIQINLGVPVLIPDSYIEDSSLRLEIYRKIGSIDSEEGIDVMEYELADRFGTIPLETHNLLTLMKIKMHCIEANVSKLDVGPTGISFSFFENKCKNLQGLMTFLNSNIVKENSGSFKIRPDQRIIIFKKWKDLKSRTCNICDLMASLSSNLRNTISKSHAP